MHVIKVVGNCFVDGTFAGVRNVVFLHVPIYDIIYLNLMVHYKSGNNYPRFTLSRSDDDVTALNIALQSCRKFLDCSCFGFL